MFNDKPKGPILGPKLIQNGNMRVFEIPMGVMYLSDLPENAVFTAMAFH